MGDSAIEWTDKTWNPVVGCQKVSEGCRHCYAKTLHDQRHKARLAGKAVPAQYAQPFEVVQLMPDRLADPLGWRKPQKVFVNSVSDLFHADVPDEFLDRVFAVMALAGRHTFQVLTKRAARMREYMARLSKSIAPLEAAARAMGWTFKFRGADGRELSTLPWPIPNVWLGVSCEDQDAADERIPELLKVPAAVRFLSCEPLLEEVDIRRFLCCHWCRTQGEPLRAADGQTYHMRGNTPMRCPTDSRGPAVSNLHWVIVGGESGGGARPCNVDWVRSLVGQCRAADVACFVKQLGAAPSFTTYRGKPSVPIELPLATRGEDPPVGGPRQTTRAGLRDRKGGEMAEWPEDLRVRQFPEVRS